MIKRNTLRFKFSLWYVITLFIILASFSSMLFFSEFYSIRRNIDDLLRIKAFEVEKNIEFQSSVERENGDYFFRVLNKMFNEDFYIEEINKMWKQRISELGLYNDYIEIISDKGKIIGKSSNIPNGVKINFPLNLLKAFKNRNILYFSDKVNSLRVIALKSKVGDINCIILIGTSLKPLYGNMRKLAVFIMIFIPLILVVTSFLGYKFVSKVLEPVNTIAGDVRKITLDNLDKRISSENLDEEIQNLVNTFNEVLERLHRSFDYIMKFNSYVSHELRTPLSIIKGESEYILRKERSTDEYRRSFENILEEINRMYKIIDDLLRFSRLSYSKEAYSMKKVEFRNFISEICDSAKLIAKQKDINFDVHINILEDVYIFADEVHLRRLFFNLLDNAFKFTPRKEKVVLSVNLQNNFVVVSIADSGPGISADEIDNIFKPFYRKEKGNEKSGAGLGLAISYSIVKAHNGEIKVESKEGEGAIFIVYLPIM